MKQHLLLATRIFNTPLAVSQDKLDVISSNVGLKLLTGEDISPTMDVPTSRPDVNTSVPIIKVYDNLVAKGGLGSSGFTSYAGINSQVEKAVSAGASRIGFDISSPGGEVNSLFSTTDFIHSLPEKFGVETFAFVDGSATSAAYAIAAATQRIYSTDTSMTGSI